MQLSGELQKVNFANLLQLVRSGGLSGRITLLQGARQALIFIDEGYPVHVEVEGVSGKDALFELFLWQSGTFAFSEGDIGGVTRSVAFGARDDSFEKMLREGLLYAEDKNYLDDLGISPRSILRVAPAYQAEREPGTNPGLDKLDGVRTLADALASLALSRREFVHTVAYWLSSGFVEATAPTSAQSNHVDLPDWVVARLKQDNEDISRSIVDMVIWVDRVKCWMYQADADFDRILTEIKAGAVAAHGQTELAQPWGFDEERQSSGFQVFGGPAPPPE
jgi:hypothetical protein